MTKILLVCLANICRSPMARAVGQQLAYQRGLSPELEFDSAGTQVWHTGERPDPRARSALLSRNYDPGKTRSRQINDQDFERFDLVVAMDEANLATLQRQCPSQHRDKLHLLLDFAPALGRSEIPDPYYGNLAGFERVLDLCELGTKGLIDGVMQRP